MALRSLAMLGVVLMLFVGIAVAQIAPVGRVYPDNIFVRSGPATTFPTIGAFFAADLVIPYAVSEDGLWVLTTYRRTYGWVQRDLLEWTNEAALDQLAVIADGIVPTPLFAPTATPFLVTVTPEGNFVIVYDSKSVNVRSGPGEEFLPMGYLLASNVVEPVGRNADTTWILIRYVNENNDFDGFGWIGRKLVQWVDEVALLDLPVLTPDNLTPSPTFTPSVTPLPTTTATITLTPSATFTASPTLTMTPTVTTTATDTPTLTPTATDIPPSVTVTPSETATIAPSVAPTVTPSETAIVTPTGVIQTVVGFITSTPLSSVDISILPTLSSTPLPTVTITPSPIPTNTDVPTATNTNVPTATNTDVPTVTNTDVPTVTNTDVPTATNTDVPTIAPTEVLAIVLPATPTSLPPMLQNSEAPAPRFPLEGVIALVVILGLIVYASFYWRGLNALQRYQAGFIVDSCPVCRRGHLTLDLRTERVLGILTARRTVRCDTCRSVLRETGSGRWRYAVDRVENPELYAAFNGREITEPELKALARPDYKPTSEKPSFEDSP